MSRRAAARLADLIERLAGAARDDRAPRAGDSGPGTPLPDGLRDRMEAAFDADFGSVRLHESAGARDIGAEAFTQGSHIHLAPGRGDARSEQGRELIGHELAHVVQQRAGARPGVGRAVARGRRVSGGRG